MEWNFFDSLNLFDTETININNIIENNIFYYKTNTLKNKLIIKDFNDVNILNKILYYLYFQNISNILEYLFLLYPYLYI